MTTPAATEEKGARKLTCENMEPNPSVMLQCLHLFNTKAVNLSFIPTSKRNTCINKMLKCINEMHFKILGNCHIYIDIEIDIDIYMILFTCIYYILWTRTPGCLSQFQFMPKVQDGVEVKAV